MLQETKGPAGVLRESGATGQPDRYTERGVLKAGETASEIQSVYEIDEYDADTNTYTVKRPTSDSLTNAELFFSRGHKVTTAAKPFRGNIDGEARWAAFDDNDGTPSVGDNVGTKADEYKLFSG